MRPKCLICKDKTSISREVNSCRYYLEGDKCSKLGDCIGAENCHHRTWKRIPLGHCSMCGKRASIKRGSILLTSGLVCPKCNKEQLNPHDVHIVDVPKGITDSVIKRANSDGLTLRALFVRILELYGKGE